MMTKIKAVLFDIDDTLYDRANSQPLVLERIVLQLPHIFEGIDKQRALDAFLESDRISTADWEAGLHVDDIRDYRSNIFLEALGLPLDYAEKITETYLREYPFINAPVDGAVELVQKASRHFKTGVISNSLPDVQYKKIETLGLGRFFSCVVLAAEINLKKPDPAIFIYAAKQLKVLPGECLYIGDNYENDIKGAKGAGMMTCWFRREPTSQINQENADFVVKNLKEAEKVLEGLASG
jgi:putative hydrolase of the HAD superfamily